MKKIILLGFCLLLNACASTPRYTYPEEYGVTCMQTEEQEEQNKKTCLRIPSYSDPVKWHRVNPWEDLGDMPELP